MSTSRIADTPVSTEDIDVAIAYLSEIMRFKMLKNQHKGHWLDVKITGPYLIARLREEFVELQDAIRALDETPSGPERYEGAAAIASEAADVANFAMMIADYYRVCEVCKSHKYLAPHATECSVGPGKALS